MKKLMLKQGKEKALSRFHPWIFSGAIQNAGDAQDGDVVKIIDSRGNFVCSGHYQKESIAVKILSFSDEAMDEAFFARRLSAALELRVQLGLINVQNNIFRWVFGEGDLLPGLVVDYYNGIAVMQCHSAGMYAARHVLASAMLQCMPAQLQAVYCKSKDVLHTAKHENVDDGFLIGSGGESYSALENGIEFQIDFIQGQKTGFFIDQRENRQLLAHYSKGKNVLNTFCYSGGFSLYALQAGARQVVSVDSSKRAIELCENNVAHNGFTNHEAVCSDVFTYLKNDVSQFDIILLDPPAFAKNISQRHNGLMGYKRLNAETIRKMRVGSLLFTFSCSQVVSRKMFEDIVLAAAIDCRKEVRILQRLSQASDHLQNIYHAEGEYLKGLLLYIGGDI